MYTKLQKKEQMKDVQEGKCTTGGMEKTHTRKEISVHEPNDQGVRIQPS